MSTKNLLNTNGMFSDTENKDCIGDEAEFIRLKERYIALTSTSQVEKMPHFSNRPRTTAVAPAALAVCPDTYRSNDFTSIIATSAVSTSLAPHKPRSFLTNSFSHYSPFLPLLSNHRSTHRTDTNPVPQEKESEEPTFPSPPFIHGSLFVEKPHEVSYSPLAADENAPNPFDLSLEKDAEAQHLLEQAIAQEKRIDQRMASMKVALGKKPITSKTAVIRPPVPSVTFAEEREILIKAEEFERKASLPLQREGQDAGQGGERFMPSKDDKRNEHNRNGRFELSERDSSRSGERLVQFVDRSSIPSSMEGQDVLLARNRIHGRSSTVRVNEITLAILNNFENGCNIDFTLPDLEDVESTREGDVLTSKTILKRDTIDIAYAKRDRLGIMSGAPYFRMAPKLNVGGVALSDTVGITTVLNEVRKLYSNGSIVWVNLGEEPVIYLNEKLYVVRYKDNPTKPMPLEGITGTRIAYLEQKLKGEIYKEAEKHGGNVCIHMELAKGDIVMLWESVAGDSAKTLVDIFNMLNEKKYDVEYYRLPLSQTMGPSPNDFQYVFNLCHMLPHTPIIYNCHTGREASSMMMVITTIVKYYQFTKNDPHLDEILMNSKSMNKLPVHHTMGRLIALLPNGHLHRIRVAALCELTDRIYSIIDCVDAACKSKEITEKVMHILKGYALLICFSCFCKERLWDKTFKGTFGDWLDNASDLKFILHTMVHQSKFHRVPQRIEVPAGEDHEVAEIVQNRRGNLLSAGMILRSLFRLPDTNLAGQGSIPGVPPLRQLCPNVPVFTCGRISAAGRLNLLYTIKLHFPYLQDIQWVSLRDHPMVFINDTYYTLEEYSVLDSSGIRRENNTFLRAERIEELEEKLINDIKDEAAWYDGFIIVHEMQASGKTVAKKIKVSEMRSPRSEIHKFADENGVRYYHFPMPEEWDPTPSDFDAVLEHFAMTSMKNEAIIINDTDGGLRTSLILNLVTAVRLACVARFRTIKSVEQLIREVSAGYHYDQPSWEALRDKEDMDETPEFIGSLTLTYKGGDEDERYKDSPMQDLQVASMICQMLAAGSLLLTTHAIIEVGGRGPEWNILDAIEEAVSGMNESRGDMRLYMQHRALNLARHYLMIILFVLYIDSQKGYNVDLPLSRWVSSLAEIGNVLNTFGDKPAISLRFVMRDNIMAAHSKERAIDMRSGDVLTANFGMKADHFPGYKNSTMRPVVSGAPNFRKIDGVNVYGVAIPTKMGASNILSVLGAHDAHLQTSPGDTNDEDIQMAYASPLIFDPKFTPFRLTHPFKGSVIWINLREEPIIYVGDRPFVFRNLTEPYVNVELTGIQSTSVEHVERKLKIDILKEANKYDGNFLVHDESRPGELVGIWEEADDGTVKTVKDVYEDLASNGARVKFLRIPVTDEQSPELKDFDSLVLAILPEVIFNARHRNGLLPDPISFVFNCQMGRGRTTTGMVVCCLLIGLVNPEYYTYLSKKYRNVYPPGASHHANGDYSCISRLRGLLSGGRTAKLKIDLVLKSCEKMQNLRTAIEGLKLQVESSDVLEETRGRALRHGIHYLHRYFNLIAFQSYLDEAYCPATHKLKVPFVDWFEGRPEIANLRDRAKLE